MKIYERATGTRSNKHIARRECSVALSLHRGASEYNVYPATIHPTPYTPPPLPPTPPPIHIRYPPCVFNQPLMS